VSATTRRAEATIWSGRGIQGVPKPVVITDAVQVRILFGEPTVLRIKGNCLL